MAKKLTQRIAAAVTGKSPPAGVPADFAKALEKHLGRLREADEKAAAATRYVLTGEPANLPLTLGGVSDAGRLLAVGSFTVGWTPGLFEAIQRERLALFRLGAGAPPAVLARLGEVIAAAARSAAKGWTAPPGWPDWLAALIGELFQEYGTRGYGDWPGAVWPAPLLAAVLAEAGLPPADAARVLLDPSVSEALGTGGPYYYIHMRAVFGDWGPFLVGQTDDVRAIFAGLTGSGRVGALKALDGIYDFAPILDAVVDMGTGSSKTVREEVLPILLKTAEAAYPHAEKWLAEGDAARRHEAAQLLFRLDPQRAAGRLADHLESETAERVRQTIQKLLAAPEELPADASGSIELPPVELPLGAVPLPEAAKARLWAHFEKWHAKANRDHEEQMRQWDGPDRPNWMSKPARPTPFGSMPYRELIEFVERGEGRRPFEPIQHHYGWGQVLGDDSFAPPGVQLIHIVRLAYGLGQMVLIDNGHGVRIDWRQLQEIEAYRPRCPEPAFGLRELDAAVASLPKSAAGQMPALYLTCNSAYGEFCNWEPEAVWPAFATDGPLKLLRDGAVMSKPNSGNQRTNAFRVLAMFPKLPPGFTNALWEIALGESKSERPLARAALRTVPGKAEKVLVALKDGRQAVRSAAAEWLGQIGDPAAIEPLKELFRTEKQEAVRGAAMSALDKLGADVNEFLDRKELLKEAAAGLAKKRPASMAWFPLERLPTVRWADNDKPVDPKIVQWWLVQAVGQKSPTCGPILRRTLELCRPADAHALARYVLSAWIARDTRTPSPEEAAERAKADAASQWKVYGSYTYWTEQYKSEANLREILTKRYLNEIAGSATAEKGMLAVTAAAGDAECARVAEAYIKKHFGQRLSQCKSLVEMLAQGKHPMALQVLLGIANRFRTRAIRDLAGQLVAAVAEREGWTIDELADRTIPDAGFSKPEGGGPAALVLDYGPRQFTAALNDELEPVVRADGGKPVKALPNPGKSDDAEKAKEAKKAFADAKKQVKEVVRRQAERLYEALCTQRSWVADDWRRYLAEHPIVGRLCVRLAWAVAGADGRLLAVFRPLEDGSLTDASDDAVALPPDASVRLAHAATVPAALSAAWRQHYADYDVAALFDQFGRDAYVLPDAKKKETELTEFRGHALTTFQLRGKATKLGYLRGDTGDGGTFVEYRKPFPSLRIAAVVEFSGSYLPESDHPAVLRGLSFVRLKPDGASEGGWNPTKVELGKVPPVLLSECYNDLKSLAAEGPGFDPQWEKVGYW